MKNSVELTEYAVEARYPGPYETVQQEEAERARTFAADVLLWVTDQVGINPDEDDE